MCTSLESFMKFKIAREKVVLAAMCPYLCHDDICIISVPPYTKRKKKSVTTA